MSRRRYPLSYQPLPASPLPARAHSRLFSHTKLQLHLDTATQVRSRRSPQRRQRAWRTGPTYSRGAHVEAQWAGLVHVCRPRMATHISSLPSAQLDRTRQSAPACSQIPYSSERPASSSLPVQHVQAPTASVSPLQSNTPLRVVPSSHHRMRSHSPLNPTLDVLRQIAQRQHEREVDRVEDGGEPLQRPH